MKAQIQRGSVLNSMPLIGDNISSIVVFDDDGQPLMAIEHIGETAIQLTRADEKGFSAALSRLRVMVPPPNVITG